MTFEYPTAVTRPGEMLGYVNTVTDQRFGIVILIVILVIAFISMKNYKTSTALASATFITMIFSIILRAMELIATPVVVMFILGACVSFAFLWFEER